jgi:NAD(P)-dependent dehydrogenase (short-subunit alcohol dehydrogenase family)
MNLRFDGLHALVTGSTRGIGRAIAQLLSDSGARVTVHGRRADDAAAVAREMATAGREVDHAQGDLSGADGCAALIAQVPDVDILVHNAGIYEWSPFFDTTDAQWQHMLQTNLLSGVRLARHHVPRMLARGWGRTVFIASDSGLNVPTDMIHYGVSKAALLALTRGVAELTAGSAVTVNAVLPGPTRTGAEGEFFDEHARKAGIPRAQAEQHFLQSVRPTSLLQRLATGEEVASMVVYACSRQAAATNGAALRAEGGILRHVG